MSFSSLPSELVHQIIELTVPHTFHTRTYKQRQRTLCSLSLVSKLFRSISQPLLFEIVKLETIDEASKLPTSTPFRGNARQRGGINWIVIVWDYLGSQVRTQEEEDRFAESLQFLASARKLTTSYFVSSDYTNWFSTISQHLTYLQLSRSFFEPSNPISLPVLHSLTLDDVSSELFRALVDPSTAPNLRNLAIVDCSQDSVQWLRKPSISRFLLQLETLYFDFDTWPELDEGFRRSVASRALVDVAYGAFETAFHPEASVIHARVDSLSFDSILPDEQVARKLNFYASSIQDSSSLKSLFLDSTFRCSSSLPALVRSSVESLARRCQERKIDLVFERVPIDGELDPMISAEFIRRQKLVGEIEARGDEAATG